MGENGLQNFIEWFLDHGYEENLTIDRKKSVKGYSPDNCQWVSQSANSYRVSYEDILPSSPDLQYSGKYSMRYNSNEQLVTELKKLLLDTKCSQRNIAKQMGISPQALQNLLNKKQLSFADLKRVLDCINCDLLVDFSVRSISAVAEE